MKKRLFYAKFHILIKKAGGEKLSHPFESYEQFCLEQQKNVIIEEHFMPNGKHFFKCNNKSACSLQKCTALKRLEQQMNKMKTFEK